ncbi:MAG TPA: LysO family transporter [Negativicutes bacterium]|nr:LysO family transporter [Negativicutes bacterium]
MWIIIVALAAGIAVGAARPLSAAWSARLGRAMTATLFLMLAALGAQIGADRELLANLPSLGWRAAVISALSIAGSVAALCFVVDRFRLAAGPAERSDD